MPIISGARGSSLYRYRAWVSGEAFADSLAAFARSLDYSNFKDEVERRGTVRAGLYHDVWHTLGSIQPGGLYST
jgi:hypothetical protein